MSTATNRPILWLVSRRWDLSLLLIMLVVAAGLRLTGLEHAIGTHPDERHIVNVTSALEANKMNPKSFAYGSFSFYAAWGFAHLVKPFKRDAVSYDGLFVVGRAFCIVMGTVAVGLSYYLSILIYRRSSVGLIAALFLAINVFHLQLSRFFTSDIPLTTLALLSLIALVKAHENRTLSSHLVFGACAGLATATKISSAFLFVPLALVVSISTLREWIPRNNWRRPLQAIATVTIAAALMVITLKLIYWKGWPRVLGYRLLEQACVIPLSIPFLAMTSYALRRVSISLCHLFAALSLGVLVFTLAEPYAILDFPTFQHHTMEQTNMVRGYWRPPYTVQYAHTLPYIYHLQQMLWYTMGWPLFIIAIIGIVIATARVLIESIDKTLRQEFLSKPLSSEVIPLTFLLVFFAATGYFQVKFPRYLLPLYPLAFMFGASLFANTFKVSVKRHHTTTRSLSTTYATTDVSARESSAESEAPLAGKGL
jgi:4-amino-4-deoxy-L-arabinose transferase-like glycosyltransferase